MMADFLTSSDSCDRSPELSLKSEPLPEALATHWVRVNASTTRGWNWIPVNFRISASASLREGGHVIGARGGHRLERLGHMEDPGELRDLHDGAEDVLTLHRVP